MPRDAGALIERRSGWLFWLLWGGAVLTAAPIWWLVALPVLQSGAASHEAHAWEVALHAAAGTFMLAAGATALYVGWTRQGFGAHKWIGYTYLVAGSAGAGMGLVLSLMSPHAPHGTAAATGVLAATWLAVTAMAWRAVRNRRYDAHREWMIRSYVLTWTFVFCRMAMRIPAIGEAGDEAITATIWATWIVPLIVCEIAINWSKTGRLRA